MALHLHPIRLPHSHEQKPQLPQQQEPQHPQQQEQQHQHRHLNRLAQDHPPHSTNRPSSNPLSPSPCPSPHPPPPAAFLPPSSSTPTSAGMPHRLLGQRTPSVDETLTTMLASSSPKSLTGSTRSASLLESAIIGNIHSRSFYSAFDTTEEILEEDPVDENYIQQGSAKRSRRLTVEQVRALEKAFEADNKLEPERKVQLANQLGLQARQVAVWFQNRRARWKTKQMERDYGTLKKKLESLRASRDELKKEKERLEAEVARLKGNINMKSEEKVIKSEAAAGSRASRSEVTSNLAVRECENAAAITTSPDQKENDGSSITEDSDGSAIVDNVDSPRQIQSSVPDVNPASTVVCPGDIVMHEEAIAMLEFSGALVTQRAIKGEEIFYEEESVGEFYPFESTWWETAC